MVSLDTLFECSVTLTVKKKIMKIMKFPVFILSCFPLSCHSLDAEKNLAPSSLSFLKIFVCIDKIPSDFSFSG